MTEGTETLVLEHLRHIRADMSKMWDDVGTVKTEVGAMRKQLVGVVTLQDHDHDDLAVRKVRVDRIERRLELAD